MTLEKLIVTLQGLGENHMHMEVTLDPHGDGIPEPLCKVGFYMDTVLLGGRYALEKGEEDAIK